MKKQLLIIAICLIGVILCRAQSKQDTLLLNEAVSLAIENNHSILIADLERQKVEFQKKKKQKPFTSTS